MSRSSRFKGGNDVWFWDEQPVYEATARRHRAVYNRRTRRSDFEPDLRHVGRASSCRRGDRRKLSGRHVVASPLLVAEDLDGHGSVNGKRRRYG